MKGFFSTDYLFLNTVQAEVLKIAMTQGGSTALNSFESTFSGMMMPLK